MLRRIIGHDFDIEDKGSTDLGPDKEFWFKDLLLKSQQTFFNIQI